MRKVTITYEKDVILYSEGNFKEPLSLTVKDDSIEFFAEVDGVGQEWTMKIKDLKKILE